MSHVHSFNNAFMFESCNPLHVLSELRKERSERAPGGVTPGDEMYNAATARARTEGGVTPAAGPYHSSDTSSSHEGLQQQQQRSVSMQRSGSAGRFGPRQPGIERGERAVGPAWCVLHLASHHGACCCLY